MTVVQLVGLGITCALIMNVMRSIQSPLMPIVLIALSVFMLGLIFGVIVEAVGFIKELAKTVNINDMMLETVLKIIGIAYIVELSANIIRDVGEEALAAKVELGGKVMILALGLPIIKTLITTVMGLMNGGV